MAEPLGHERQISFFQKGGHDHDGENSTPVVILPGAINLFHLNDALKDWIRNNSGGIFGGGSDGVMPVPDLVFETPPVGPGASVTGILPWVGLAVVRFMRVLMTAETECTITFYHDSSFLDENREFRAYRCSNRFMWEGAWAHYDEQDAKQIYYRIENTGNNGAVFQVTLKSAVMAANAYARFVEDINANGQSVTGHVNFIQGNGMQIVADGQNVIFTAVAPETVVVRRWTKTPRKPTGFTSSASISSVTNLNDGNDGTYTTFGTGIQWIQADMGSIVNLGAVSVGQYVNGDGRVFNGVRLEVSPDGTNWLEIKASGTHWAVEGGFTCEIASGYLARYIRLWCNGSNVDANNYVSSIIPYVLSNKE